MLVLDMWLALGIAIFMGIPGIPYAFWLLRKLEFSAADKLVIGYTIGWVGVPLLFLLESIVGIDYAAPWIAVNWIAGIIPGIYLLHKEGMLSGKALEGVREALAKAASDPLGAVRSRSAGIFLFLLVAAAVLVRLSSAGGLLFELDPYFYLDGVRQVVYQGRNFFDDKTAWYPFTQSSHVGNPLYKYLLAPWFSLYNGSAPYSPYVLSAVSSIYAPLAGGLAVYFFYLLFREMYDKRAGVLAAGLAAFLPFFMIKFQGGDSQIVPYSIFALVFFLSMLYSAIRRRSAELTWLAGLAYAALILGSNIEILIVFCLAVFMFALALRHVLDPDDDSRAVNKLMVTLFCIMLAVQVIDLFYPEYTYVLGGLKGWAVSLAENFLSIAAAFAIPLAVDRAFERYSPSTPRHLRAGACVAAVIVVGLVVLQLSIFGDLVSLYRYWGSYSTPLTKTIAEQAPGSPTYDGVFGFVAMNFDGTNPLSALLAALNLIPTAVFNLFFNIIASVANIALGGAGNFPIIDRADSALTLSFFLGIGLLSCAVLSPLLRKKYMPVYPLMLLAFILPMTFMGLEKEKLITYLGVTVIFSACAAFAECHDILASLLGRKEGEPKRGKRKDDVQVTIPSWLNLGSLAWLAAVLLISLEFGFPLAPAAAYGAPVLSSSFTPTFQQDPAASVPLLSSICSKYQDPLSCAVSRNVSAYTSDPAVFYDSGLCARSLLGDPSQQASTALQIAISYRCSFVSQYWISAMEWIHGNVPQGDRVISWWDYGHWINFLGQSYTVLRNEHANQTMIGQTAYAYLDTDAAGLRSTMNAFHSRYAVMDIEIVGSGDSRDSISFGGKYGALNYLACAYANQTDVTKDPGGSQCEADHLWESIVIPTAPQPCGLTPQGNQSGYVAYRLASTANGTSLATSLVPAYCAFVGKLEDGRQALITYDLNSRDPSGALSLHPAIWVPEGNSQQYVQFAAIYDHEQLWRDSNGTLIDSYPYRTTAFYNSTLYQGFMLGSIDGYDLVYDTPQVRIFRMKDQYYAG